MARIAVTKVEHKHLNIDTLLLSTEQVFIESFISLDAAANSTSSSDPENIGKDKDIGNDLVKSVTLINTNAN